MTQVLIARVEVQPGLFLTARSAPELFEGRAIAKALLPEGAITEMKDLQGKLVLKPVHAGDFIYQSNLADSASIPPLIKPGERACSLRVWIDQQTVNRAPPGTRVDLLCKNELPDTQVEWTTIAEGVMSLSV